MAAAINKESDNSGYIVTEYPKVKLEWYDEMMKLNSQFAEATLVRELGPALPYYKALKNIREMHPLQCRIDFIEIK